MALASDTITTLGGAKTLGTSSKIYELGEAHKVVVLHNSCVDINNVSSQLHIAEWSLTLSKTLPTVEAYLNSFVEWFNSSRGIYGADSADSLVYDAVVDYFKWIAGNVRTAIRESIDEALDLNEVENARPGIISEKISSNIAMSKKWMQFDGLSDQAGEEILTATKDLNISTVIDENFVGIDLTSADKKKLRSAATLAVSRRSKLPSDSELVFAGFGSEEPFAKLIRVIVRGAYGGKLRWHVAGKDEVNATHPTASMSTLAQDDAIHGFARGWTSLMRDHVESTTFETVWSVLENELPEEMHDKLFGIAEKIRIQVLEKVDETSLEKFAYPFMNTVTAMSLISMAQLAESLIGIQATSTYSKAGAATVGGFIEVVTIDRINGVRWRKRLSDTF
jgi:hypothetical protein